MNTVKRVLCLVVAMMLLCTSSALASSHASQISSVMSSFSSQNTRADNIYQQICNGTYRTTELLTIIAYELDTSGAYASQIRSVQSSFSSQSTRADNIYQQICNGTYRTTELAAIVAYELDN